MRTLIVVLIALLLSACGGAPAANKQTTYYGSGASSQQNYMDSFIKRTVDKGGYVITMTEFPELYPLIVKSEWNTLLPLLGNSGSIAYGTVDFGKEKVIYMQPAEDSGDGPNPVMAALLYYVTMKGDLGKAREFIAKGADPNSAAKYREPLLHVVLGNEEGVSNRFEVIAMLLEEGADPNLKSRRGRTPLSVVMRSDADDAGEMISRLLKAGADPNAKNNEGETVLLALLDRWDETPDKAALAGLLLEAGADPDATDSDGETALHVVLDKGNEIPDRMALVSMLLEAGADPNARSSEGTTALNAAISSDIKDKGLVIARFLEHGADPNLTGRSGETALHALIRTLARDEQGAGDETAIAWVAQLIEKGAHPDARNHRGKTPLSFAFFGDMENVVEYLLGKGASDYGIKSDAQGVVALEGLSVLGMGSAEIVGLNRKQCSFILREYDVEFEHLKDIKGVEFPIRLKSPVGGITYRHTGGNGKFSIIDCRLAVVLVGWGPILHDHDVVEVEHMRVYSPDARVGGGSKVSGHSFALAIDAAHFILEDGTELVMKKDWTDRKPGAEPCRDTVPDGSKAQKTLREITCDTGGIDLFSSILTPHYNKAHYDHLHMELTGDLYMFVR